MRSTRLVFSGLFILFFSSSYLFGATRIAVLSGNFNDAATWGGDPVPGPVDVAVIAGGVTVTLTNDVVVSFLTANGTVDLAGNDLTTGDLNGGFGLIDNRLAGSTSTFTFGDPTSRSFNGRIRDTGAGSMLNIVKNGSGAQTLGGGGSNDFSGTTTINSGDLVLNKPNNVLAIGGDITIGDGTGLDDLILRSDNQIRDNSIVTISSLGASSKGRFILNGYNETLGGLLGSGGDGLVIASLSGSPEGMRDPSILTIEVDAGQTYLYDGNLRDDNNGVGAPKLSVVKTGAGTQEFTRIAGSDIDFNISGTITVSDGRLLFDNMDALDVSEIIVNSSFADALTFDQDGVNFTADFPISGSGEVTKTGAGLLEFRAVNTYTGNTDIQEGTLVLGVANAIPATNTINVDGTLDLDGKDATFGSFEGSGVIDTRSGTGTSTLTTGSDNTNKTFSGSIRNSSGTLALLKTGAGTLTLSGANTYNSFTNIMGGVLKLGSSNTIPNTSAVIVGAGATLDLNGFSEIVGSISGAGTIDNLTAGGNSTLTFGGDNTSTTFSGNIINTTGNLSLTKTGAGTTTISGNNTYNGLFNLLAGTITLGSVNALSSTGTLALNGSGVLDLNGFDTSVENIISSATTAQIIDNSSSAGTTNFSVTEQTTRINCLILDGTIRSIAFNLINRNTSVEVFNASSASTFSGGLILKDGSSIGPGTRLLIRSPPNNVGSPGAIVSSPFGTGTIFIGETSTDKASVFFTRGAENSTILNDIVFNSKIGTDVKGSLRNDVTNATLEGTMISNLSDISISTFVGGDLRFTGKLTGLLGVEYSLTDPPFAGRGPLTITSDNQTGSINDYMNSTVVSKDVTLILNGASQIPDGSATIVDGVLQIRGNDETVGSIAGTGVINNALGTGTYTLTSGGDNLNTEFSGSIQNSSGELALFKVGNGTLTLSGNSSFNGDVSFPDGSNVDGGVISVAHSNGLGIGPKTVSMSGNENTVQRILLSGGISVNNVNIETDGRNNGNSVFIENVSGNNTWEGDITIIGPGGAYYISSLADKLTLSGTLSNNLTLPREFRFNATGDIEVTGDILDGNNPIELEKRNGGILSLSGSNNYTGLTDVRDGVLQLGSTTALGTIAGSTIVAIGASLDLNGINYSNIEALTVRGSGDAGNGVIYNSNATGASYSGPITLTASSTFTSGNDILLSGNISGSGFDLTKNGANTLSFVSNTITIDDLALAMGSIDAGVSTINIEGAFTSSGVFIPNNSQVRFIGMAVQTIPDVDFHDMEIVNANGVNLSATIASDGLIDMTTGILNTLAFEIDLGAAGSLNESNPNTIAPSSYITGNVRATRNVIQNVSNNFGGIGCTITESTQASNSTVVIRTTGTGYTVDGETSILRSFDISPTVNTGLSATLISDYFDHELFGHTESNLVHYRSTDGGTTFNARMTTVNQVNNSATTSGISAFSIWTLSDVINNPLPIQLTSFYATLVGETVELTWVTSSELNNDFFTLEKSDDGINWVKVIDIDGSGTTRSQTNYSFIDTEPLRGLSYYRLMQTDFNGDKEYFDQVPVNMEFGNNTVCSLYPLPASKENLNLVIDSSELGDYDLKLVNILGVELGSFTLQHTETRQVIQLNELGFSGIGEQNYLILKLEAQGTQQCLEKILFD